MLKIRNMTAFYHRGFPILSDISLDLAPGEKLTVLGRNGAGKTTLARSIFGILPFIEGSLEYHGQDLKRKPLESLLSLGMSFFMQDAPVFPQMSVKENLLMASGNMPKKAFITRLDELRPDIPILQGGGMDPLAAGSLSGGERTQLCMAMALFRKPSLLVMDEPFAGLSPRNAGIIIQLLNSYYESMQPAMILIAQDRQMARSFEGSIMFIRDGSLCVE